MPKFSALTMQTFTTIQSLRDYLKSIRAQNLTIGLVPTMGALHDGHLSLIKASKLANDVTVCSIFVNPVQFNNPEDLEKYPRTLAADQDQLEFAGCDILFAPEVNEMYSESPQLTVDFGELERVMEGEFRPGHFNGVAIVVSKLFNIVQPDQAYFGQKDLQQTAVIKRMVKDFSFQLQLNIIPTLREADGLAMSSRNVRLSTTERSIAPQIFTILSATQTEIQSGIAVKNALAHAEAAFKAIPEFQLEYLSFVDNSTLQPQEQAGPKGTNALCIAIYLGNVRLIDNLIF